MLNCNPGQVIFQQQRKLTILPILMDLNEADSGVPWLQCFKHLLHPISLLYDCLDHVLTISWQCLEHILTMSWPYLDLKNFLTSEKAMTSNQFLVKTQSRYGTTSVYAWMIIQSAIIFQFIMFGGQTIHMQIAFKQDILRAVTYSYAQSHLKLSLLQTAWYWCNNHSTTNDCYFSIIKSNCY